MDVINANRGHLSQMLKWFPDKTSCQNWGGPKFRFPFDEASFLQDSMLEIVPSFVLTDGSEAVLGFGQCRPYNGRSHLSRIAIDPTRRAEGLGTILMAELMRVGRMKLGLREFSLYVSYENTEAERLYVRLGFSRCPPSPGAELQNNHFLTHVGG